MSRTPFLDYERDMQEVADGNQPPAPSVGCFRCGHTKTRHERPGFEPQCIAEGCTCSRFQAPNPTGAVQARVPAAAEIKPARKSPGEPTAEQLIAAGKRSDAKRTVALSVKILGLLSDLEGRLVDERGSSEARREIAELEEKLAAAKAKLRGERAARATATPATSGNSSTSRGGGSLRCPDCDKECATATGLGSHRHHAHGYRAGAS